MSRIIRVSYPVAAEAFNSPIPEEQHPTIEGCSRENCGAWGTGVCRITVEAPNEIKKDNLATYKSQTFLSELGCIICGDMEGDLDRGNALLTTGSGTIPLGIGREKDDYSLLSDAVDLALPDALDAIQNRTQREAELRAN